jgi:hypothetical protein
MFQRILKWIIVSIVLLSVIMPGYGVDPARGESFTNRQFGITERVSIDSYGTEGNYHSTNPSVSADGRVVAFESLASNLVSWDSNWKMDIFVHDRQTGETKRVSVASNGTQGNDESNEPSISADGRFVVYHSYATNLISGDTNGAPDIFIHDLQTGVTELVSLASNGTQGNGSSIFPTISADGRFVAFHSGATNLVSEDTNEALDVFVHDRQTGVTERVSVASDGTQGNNESVATEISGDGRFVAFVSDASNLVEGDTNDSNDIFVHDRQTGVTERVSVASDGTQGDYISGNLTISSDGRFVAFESASTNLVSGDTNGVWDIFVHDRQTGITERVSVSSDGIQGNDHSGNPTISADGRFVGFNSLASNFVYGEPLGNVDIYLHDRQTGATELVSVAMNGEHSHGNADYPSSSADGGVIAFMSGGDDLVIEDHNCATDVFVYVLSPLHVFLPNIEKSPVGFKGKVTMNGNPAAGVPVDLRLFDGTNSLTVATTTTTADGSYVFYNTAPLSSGQYYWVRFRNTTNPDQLSLWCTGIDTTYNATHMVTFETFDILNIYLTQPSPGSAVKLPVTFQWLPRPPTPTDSYEFNLFEYDTGNPSFYTEPLGYVDSYTLTSLPPGFNYNTLYCWGIVVYSPEGGYGSSYYCFGVTFNRNLSGEETGAPVLQSIPRLLMPDWDQPHLEGGN